MRRLTWFGQETPLVYQPRFTGLMQKPEQQLVVALLLSSEMLMPETLRHLSLQAVQAIQAVQAVLRIHPQSH
jgi:hypothetical protein